MVNGKNNYDGCDLIFSLQGLEVEFTKSSVTDLDQLTKSENFTMKAKLIELCSYKFNFTLQVTFIILDFYFFMSNRISFKCLS